MFGFRWRSGPRAPRPDSTFPLLDPDQMLHIEAQVRSKLTRQCLRLVGELNADRRIVDAVFDTERGSLVITTGSRSVRLAVADDATGEAVACMVRLEDTFCLASTAGAGSVSLEFSSESWRYYLSGIPALEPDKM